MPNIVRSARGVMVDFDLLKIKERMESVVPPQTVTARKDFVDKRLRRKLSKGNSFIESPEDIAEEDVVKEELIQEANEPEGEEALVLKQKARKKDLNEKFD